MNLLNLSELAQAVRTLLALPSEDALATLDAGTFDGLLEAMAGAEAKPSGQRYADVQPFSHVEWLRRRTRGNAIGALPR